MNLATCSYQEYDPSMGIPVQASRGAPKFWRHGPLLPWPLVMPTWQILKINDEETYRRAYLSRLDQIGPDRVTRALPGLLDAWKAARIPNSGVSDDRLVLMCFEKLSVPGKWCHRTMLSDWIRANTGIEVIELGGKPQKPDSLAKSIEPTLF
ncbi:hypothetical protein [Corynebacterium argentoratense]|uniref:hypothetical protein n=1 Tax=Corynebacterium argentoratense TaxID=42817 RepID=UPI001F31BC05|nr:hypothetical protein [Corynebacterium argentoratense]MCF1694302.1 hypothetical protein [Corynebacterium argentoratense]MCF1735873.1 hypothetical protein [Corynebacterium argentoratense]